MITAAPTAAETPARDTPTTRRGRGRDGVAAGAVAIRARTVCVAVSTDSAKPAFARGLALRSASKLSDMLAFSLKDMGVVGVVLGVRLVQRLERLAETA